MVARDSGEALEPAVEGLHEDRSIGPASRLLWVNVAVLVTAGVEAAVSGALVDGGAPTTTLVLERPAEPDRLDGGVLLGGDSGNGNGNGNGNGYGYGQVDLSRLGKAELVRMAADLGVPGRSRMRKDELIAAIEAQR